MINRKDAIRELMISLLVAQAGDGIEIGGAVGGVVAKKEAYRHRDGDAEHNPQERQRGGNGRSDGSNQEGDARADGNSYRATGEREHGGLEQELYADVGAACADGLTNPDFAGAFGDGDEHDVHDSDAAHQQSDGADDAGENDQRARELVPERAEEIGSGDLEIVFTLGRHAADVAHDVLDLFDTGLGVDAGFDRKGDNQLFRLGPFLVEVAEGDNGELVDTGTSEKAGLAGEDSDHLIVLAVEMNNFAERVDAGKQGVGDVGADYDHRAGVFLVKA